MRLIAEVTEPLAVCRPLLKIGLEQLGKHFYEVAMSERVQAARDFARKPRRGDGRWFILRSNPEEYGPGGPERAESSIEVIEREGILLSVMHMLGVSPITPLERRALPAEGNELSEPEFRTVLDLFRIPSTYPRPVTIANLLTHTGGFDERYVGIAARAETEVLGLGPYLAARMPPRVMPPGDVISYSNHGMALAG